MEETLFECTYTDSEEILYEAYRRAIYKKQVMTGWYYLIAAIWVAALNFFVFEELGWTIVFILLLVWGVRMIWQPKMIAESTMTAIRRSNQGEVPPAYLTVTTKITHKYKFNTSIMMFPDILEVYFLPHCIVLIEEDGRLTFDRNGFTKGTPEEFEAFLRQKCPDAKFVCKGGKKSTERVL